MKKVYISTTFYGASNSPVESALEALSDLEIDGIEIGSTHRYDGAYKEKVQEGVGDRDVITHNYCIPSEEDLVINVASRDIEIRRKSIEKIKECLDFSSEIGSKLYTFHPGFLADAVGKNLDTEKGNFDFNFSKDVSSREFAVGAMRESLNEIVEYASSLNVKIAVESEGSLDKSDILLLRSPSEFEDFLKDFENKIQVNFNVAHSHLSAKALQFKVSDLVELLQSSIAALELSHCNLVNDQHLPFEEESYLWDFLNQYSLDVPHILEFRNASKAELKTSIDLLKRNIG